MLPRQGNFTLLANRWPLTPLSEALRLEFIGWGYSVPGFSWAPNPDDFYLIHYIVSGKGTVILNDTAYTVGARQAFWMAPDVRGWYRADREDPFVQAFFAFKGTAAPKAAQSLVLSREHPLSTGYGGGLPSLCMELVNGLETVPQPEWFCLELLMRMLAQFASSASTTLPRAQQHVARAQQYIHQHYAEHITIQQVAQAQFLDRSHLARLFKTSTGLTPHEYLLRYRLNRAKEALAYSCLPLSAIAQAVGFEQYSSFYRSFIAQEGVTPQQWRQQTAGAGRNHPPSFQDEAQ